MVLRAKVSGYGPRKLLMLHGWLSDHHVFDQIAPCFRQTDYTLVRMDYRGYGLNRGVKGSYSIDEVAADVLELCAALGWRHYAVVGHSMGGMVLQKMAILQPGAMTSAVAITPVPASGFPMDDATAAFFRSSADDDAALTGIFDTLTGKKHARPFLENMVAATRAATTRDAYLGYLESWATTDFSSQVSQLPVPVHVVAGADDHALGPEFLKQTYLAQLPDVRMTVVDNVGHYPMLERPPELFRIVEASLA